MPAAPSAPATTPPPGSAAPGPPEAGLPAGVNELLQPQPAGDRALGDGISANGKAKRKGKGKTRRERDRKRKRRDTVGEAVDQISDDPIPGA